MPREMGEVKYIPFSASIVDTSIHSPQEPHTLRGRMKRRVAIERPDEGSRD
jgi:hypothetical protein